MLLIVPVLVILSSFLSVCSVNSVFEPRSFDHEYEHEQEYGFAQEYELH